MRPDKGRAGAAAVAGKNPGGAESSTARVRERRAEGECPTPRRRPALAPGYDRPVQLTRRVEGNALGRDLLNVSSFRRLPSGCRGADRASWGQRACPRPADDEMVRSCRERDDVSPARLSAASSRPQARRLPGMHMSGSTANGAETLWQRHAGPLLLVARYYLLCVSIISHSGCRD